MPYDIPNIDMARRPQRDEVEDGQIPTPKRDYYGDVDERDHRPYKKFRHEDDSQYLNNSHITNDHSTFNCHRNIHPDSVDPDSCLFVGGLHRNDTREELLQFLQDAIHKDCVGGYNVPRIVDCFWLGPWAKPYAKIVLADPSQTTVARDVLDNKFFVSRCLVVELWKDDEKQLSKIPTKSSSYYGHGFPTESASYYGPSSIKTIPSPRGSPMSECSTNTSSRTLFVINIPNDITRENMSSFFHQSKAAAEVVYCEMIRPNNRKGHQNAKVEMATSRQAADAIKYLSGARWGDKTLHIVLWKNRKIDNASLRVKHPDRALFAYDIRQDNVVAARRHVKHYVMNKLPRWTSFHDIDCHVFERVEGKNVYSACVQLESRNFVQQILQSRREFPFGIVPWNEQHLSKDFEHQTTDKSDCNLQPNGSCFCETTSDITQVDGNQNDKYVEYNHESCEEGGHTSRKPTLAHDTKQDQVVAEGSGTNALNGEGLRSTHSDLSSDKDDLGSSVSITAVGTALDAQREDELSLVSSSGREHKEEALRLRNELSEANAALQREKEYLLRLQQEMGELKSKYSNNLAKEKANFLVEIAAMKKQLKADLESERAKMNLGIQTTKSDAARLEKELLEAKKTIQELRDMNSEQEMSARSDIELYKTKLEKEKTVKESYKAMFEKEKTDKESYQAKLEKEKADKDAYRAKLEKQKSDFDGKVKADLQKEKKILNDKFKVQLEYSRKLHASEKEKLAKKLEHVTSKNVEIGNKLDKAEKANKTISESLVKMKNIKNDKIMLENKLKEANKENQTLKDSYTLLENSSNTEKEKLLVEKQSLIQQLEAQNSSSGSIGSPIVEKLQKKIRKMKKDFDSFKISTADQNRHHFDERKQLLSSLEQERKRRNAAEQNLFLLTKERRPKVESPERRVSIIGSNDARNIQDPCSPVRSNTPDSNNDQDDIYGEYDV